MVEFTRRKLMATSAAAALGASVSGIASAEKDPEDTNTPRAPSVKGKIERFSTTALGAEVTGPEVTKDGTLFYSLQHPSRENPVPFNRGGIGYFKDFTFSFDGDDEFDELGVPNTKEKQSTVRSAAGEYTLLASEDDNIGDNEDLGVPKTPSGVNVDEFAGTRYSDLGNDPDCNRLIATDDAGTEGYLFTNFEQSPGDITRLPVSEDSDGEWSADLANGKNLADTDELRDVGGTRINCYGDRSPWNTYLSAEEEYSHPRLTATATTSEILEKGSGVGLRGGAQFYNRPNPAETGSSEWADTYNDGTLPQGSFALSGLELQAYYLGADPVDQDGTESTTTPIESPYPNPYRYGYIVEFSDPTADVPTVTKHYVTGRSSHEAPDVQSDGKTVYLTSDGVDKGFYKFVADEPIPSYDDRSDVAGTLYVAKVTNGSATTDASPADVNLELDWMALGTASNAEIESWIEEYDDIDQTDYLAHADTDWEDDLETALAEADEEVLDNGNEDFIADEDVLEWADQWKANGPDGVDEDLRRVAFLEPRAAAKEIGASVEFRKSEGVDTKEGAGPGDYLYLAVSFVDGSGMSDDEGDVRLDQVDGGVVYRAELGDDYDISTLEPVIVGPDGSDPASVADDALLNVDNVLVMDDGRVLCCEDADQFGRSFPNDSLWVYTPPEDDTSRSDESDAAYYQVDLVVGQHITHLRQPYYYTPDELVRFAHGNTTEGVTRRSAGEFITDDADANAIKSHDITATDGTATTTFTVAEDSDPIQLSLVSYEKVGPGWSPKTEAEQTLVDWDTATCAPGTHTLTVDLPGENAE